MYFSGHCHSGWGLRRLLYPIVCRSGQRGRARSLIRYAITNIASFSTAPMQIVTWLGGLFLLIGTVLGIQTLVHKLTGQALEGFTTVILIQLLACGAIMLSLGIIGFYVARIYDEIKGRPRYIISETRGQLRNDDP